jgi:hypothetical protein
MLCPGMIRSARHSARWGMFHDAGSALKVGNGPGPALTDGGRAVLVVKVLFGLHILDFAEAAMYIPRLVRLGSRRRSTELALGGY